MPSQGSFPFREKGGGGGGISSVGACEGEGEFYFSCLYLELEQDVWAPTRHSPVKIEKKFVKQYFYSDKIDTVLYRYRSGTGLSELLTV